MLHETKKRVYEVKTIDGNFRFFADDKELAEDHVWTMSSFPNFKATSKVKFIGWAFESDNLDKMFMSV